MGYYQHYLFSNNNVSQISLKNLNSIEYKVLTGSDPLDIVRTDNGGKVFINNLQTNPMDGKYPDIIHQYLTSFVPGKSSDVLVTSSKDFHFGKVPRLGWRFGYHRGSHGGPSDQEMTFNSIVTGSDSSYVYNNPIRSKDLIKKCLDSSCYY